MSFSKPNFSLATNTKLRNTPLPFAGLCMVCLDGCPQVIAKWQKV